MEAMKGNSEQSAADLKSMLHKGDQVSSVNNIIPADALSAFTARASAGMILPQHQCYMTDFPNLMKPLAARHRVDS